MKHLRNYPVLENLWFRTTGLEGSVELFMLLSLLTNLEDADPAERIKDLGLIMEAFRDDEPGSSEFVSSIATAETNTLSVQYTAELAQG